MKEKKAPVKKDFTIQYKGEALKVFSDDHLIFDIEFPDGKQKQLTFQMSNNLDLHWMRISGESTATIQEIGRLIESQIMG